jgi:hypothetical protein
VKGNGRLIPPLVSSWHWERGLVFFRKGLARHLAKSCLQFVRSLLFLLCCSRDDAIPRTLQRLPPKFEPLDSKPVASLQYLHYPGSSAAIEGIPSPTYLLQHKPRDFSLVPALSGSFPLPAQRPSVLIQSRSHTTPVMAPQSSLPDLSWVIHVISPAGADIYHHYQAYTLLASVQRARAGSTSNREKRQETATEAAPNGNSQPHTTTR